MSKTVLVVDDEPDVRTSVSQVVEMSGYKVVEAENGIECLEKLHHVKPDLLLLDIMMPGMSGWDVAAKLRENPSWGKIPIVFLTAKGDDMSVGMGKATSLEYITKPFDVLELKQCIEKILK